VVLLRLQNRVAVMPVYPLEWRDPSLNIGYGNMSRRDLPIWLRFVEQYHQRLQRVAYNVAFGGQIPDDPGATEDQLLGYQWSTAFKVDVLADVGDEWWLIEVKPSPDLGAVGQVIGYYLLQEREQFTERIVIPTIVTDFMVPDVAYVAQAMNVQVFLVPEVDRATLV